MGSRPTGARGRFWERFADVLENLRSGDSSSIYALEEHTNGYAGYILQLNS